MAPALAAIMVLGGLAALALAAAQKMPEPTVIEPDPEGIAIENGCTTVVVHNAAGAKEYFERFVDEWLEEKLGNWDPETTRERPFYTRREAAEESRTQGNVGLMVNAYLRAIDNQCRDAFPEIRHPATGYGNIAYGIAFVGGLERVPKARAAVYLLFLSRAIEAFNKRGVPMPGSIKAAANTPSVGYPNDPPIPWVRGEAAYEAWWELLELNDLTEEEVSAAMA